MVATILSHELAEALKSFQEKWRLKSITEQLIDGIPENEFTHIIIDYDLIDGGNSKASTRIIERLKPAAVHGLILVSQKISMVGSVGQEMLKLGIPPERVVFGSFPEIKMQIDNILSRDLSPGEAKPDIKPPITILPRFVDETKAPVPPTPIEPIRRVTQIAVVGAGPRIGATTQALQILFYLKKQGYNTCLVEVQRSNSLAGYIEICKKGEYEFDPDNPSHFKILDCDIYTSKAAALRDRYGYDVMVLDYGPFDSISDCAELLEKDNVIVACGVKPGETCFLESEDGPLETDNGTFRYIYTFVPTPHQVAIKKSMPGDTPARTYFAPYTPSQLDYCEHSSLYELLLSKLTIDRRNKKRKTFWGGWWKRGRRR